MNDLVPDVVDEAPPRGKLQITYAAQIAVCEGNELAPRQVKDQPTVIWEEDDQNVLYTLLMVDPDAPSRADPKLREILHWSVINIPGNQLCKGQTVAEYIGSGPPAGTGLHRYIFLLYRQSGRIEETQHISNSSRQGRISFSARKFAAKHGLDKPIAGNYYQAEYDDYVPILQKSLTN